MFKSVWINLTSVRIILTSFAYFNYAIQEAVFKMFHLWRHVVKPVCSRCASLDTSTVEQFRGRVPKPATRGRPWTCSYCSALLVAPTFVIFQAFCLFSCKLVRACNQYFTSKLVEGFTNLKRTLSSLLSKQILLEAVLSSFWKEKKWLPSNQRSFLSSCPFSLTVL